MSTAKITKNVVLSVILLLLLVGALYPYVWNLSTSLKPANEMMNSSLLPSTVTFEHYADFFRRAGVLPALINSLGISLISAGLATFLGLLAAYALVRFRLRGERTILQLILGAQFIPIAALILPVYLVVAWLNLIDNWLGLILVYLAVTVPFSTWMLMGFVAKVPVDVEEAALVDGTSRFGAVMRVTLPLAFPGIFVTMVLSFIKVWEEYLVGVVLTETPASRTLPVVIAGLESQTSFQLGTMMAGLVVAGAPPILAFLFLHRYFLRGLSNN